MWKPGPVKVIDSHTGGEPTRIVVSGGPDLGTGPLTERVKRFKEQFDDFRTAIMLEPRGSDILVGGLLVPPDDASAQFGIIFFNNVGYLGMCGHGTIGLGVTLAHLGMIQPGVHGVDTPVGVVSLELHQDQTVSVQNVPSYRYKKSVAVEVPGIGKVVGDIAWGGNWFFLVADHGQQLNVANTEKLVDYTWKIRQALTAQNITGENGGEIDHIELFASSKAGNDSQNFVLCPGKAYDRSPCGTGTSAKLACLAADGKLKQGELWLQESIVGSIFSGRYMVAGERIIPTITGSAHIMAETTLLFTPGDPFLHGIRT